MYYCVAIQMDPSPTRRWKSTVLSSINTLLHWLQYYRVLPHDRLRIFSSSLEDLNEQLVQENQGLRSTSVPAAQFLQERRIAPQAMVREASAGETQANERMAYIASESQPSPNQSSRSPLEKRREELECGAGGDHDLPYEFTLPTTMPQVLAWVKLMVRVRESDLQPEVAAIGMGSGKSHTAYLLVRNAYMSILFEKVS